MKRIAGPIGFVVVLLLTSSLTNCGTTRPPIGARQIVEQVPGDKPEWTWKIPQAKDGLLFYRGVKTQAPSLEGGLTDARQNAIQQIIESIQSLGKSYYVKARVESGVAADDKDYGSFIKDGFALLADNLARGVKETESYYEREQETTGVNEVTYRYNYWVLVKYPEAEYQRALREVANQQLEQARKEKNSKAEVWAEELLQSLE